MQWDKMTELEPELRHIEQSARRAKRQSADWHDWWAVHQNQLYRLVGANAQHPALRSDECYQAAHAHLATVWANAEVGGRSRLPWNSRPAMTTEPTST